MMTRFAVTAVTVTLTLLCLTGIAAAQEANGFAPDGIVIADDIAPYDGPIGPGSPLYGLKIAFEDIDESFTSDETERVNKQVNNSRLRLAEVKRELARNNPDAAERALALYGQKANITQLRLAALSSPNATGLLRAQEMVKKHQAVLANLLRSHPDNTGLARAYNNSLKLEQKFEERTQVRFEKMAEKNNRTIVKAVRLATKERERTENTGENQTLRIQQTRKVTQGQANGRDSASGNKVAATPAETNGQSKATPAVQKNSGDAGNGSGKANVTGNGKNGNAGTDNSGQGNGKNR